LLIYRYKVAFTTLLKKSIKYNLLNSKQEICVVDCKNMKVCHMQNNENYNDYIGDNSIIVSDYTLYNDYQMSVTECSFINLTQLLYALICCNHY